MPTQSEIVTRQVNTENEIVELQQQADRLVSQLQAIADRTLGGAQLVRQSLDANDGVHEQGTLDKIKQSVANVQTKIDAVTARIAEIMAI